MKRNIYETLKNIADAYYCELVTSELRDDVLEILTDDLIKDLERVLGKIVYYGKLNN